MSSNTPIFEQILPGLFCFRDTCNVYVLKDGDEAVLIDFGSGRVLDELGHIGVRKVRWVVHTHHHREQCQGDFVLKRKRIRLAVPAAERAFFEHVEDYWQRPERFGVVGAAYCRPLIESVPVDRAIGDSESFQWKGYDLHAYAAPGHSRGAMYYVCHVAGKRVAFVGDNALAGAKLHNYYDSEWDYGYAEGHITLLRSIAKLRRDRPEVVCPSHGEVMRDPERDLALLWRRLKSLIYDLVLRHWDKDDNPYYSCSVSDLTPIPGVRRVTEHIFKLEARNCYIIVSDDGHGLMLDAGMAGGEAGQRWLDATLRGMGTHYGLKGIDAVNISHYHGDHLPLVPYVAKKHRAQVWCHEYMTEVIEHPERFNLTCLPMAYNFPFTGIPVDRELGDGEVVKWRGFDLKCIHLPGQTYYAMAFVAQIDGLKVVFTDDNIFHSPAQSGHDAFIARNRGILEEGYIQCAETLAALEPDLILGQHAQEIPKPGRQIRQMVEWSHAFRRALKRLSFFPQYEYFIDPYWVCLYPYRNTVRPGGSIELTASVANHKRRSAPARLALRVPEGWQVEPQSVDLRVPGRSTARAALTLSIPKTAAKGQHAVAADVTFDRVPYGELFDALVRVE